MGPAALACMAYHHSDASPIPFENLGKIQRMVFFLLLPFLSGIAFLKDMTSGKVALYFQRDDRKDENTIKS